MAFHQLMAKKIGLLKRNMGRFWGIPGTNIPEGAVIPVNIRPILGTKVFLHRDSL